MESFKFIEISKNEMKFNLENLLYRIVSKSFHELKDQKIKIEYAEIENAYFGFSGNKKGYEMYVDPKMKKASKNLVVGGIAHELCHIVNEMHLSSYVNRKDRLLYKKNSHYFQLDEKNTDLQAILRGYGKEILTLSKLKKRVGGLTPEDVKKLLKK